MQICNIFLYIHDLSMLNIVEIQVNEILVLSTASGLNINCVPCMIYTRFFLYLIDIKRLIL